MADWGYIFVGQITAMLIEVTEEFVPFLQPYRYKVAYGGRGAVKSWTIAALLVARAKQQSIRVLCARELQMSLSESVLQLLSDTIDRMGYSNFFTVLKNEIVGANGSKFLFCGIKTNVRKVKSMEGIDIAWVEEAESVSADSWQVLIPTMRKANSEIWVSFNPGSVLDDTYKRFIINPPPNSYIVKVNWQQNPWFPDVLRAEKDELKRNDHELYMHVWEGEPVSDAALSIIKPMWIAAARDAHIKLGITPTGERIAGFDVADAGADYNAFIARRGVVLEHISEWKDIDPASATQKVFNASLLNNVGLVLYDNIGVGAGAKGTARELTEAECAKDTKGGHRLKPPRFEGFNAAAAVQRPESDYRPGRKNKDQFLNLKAQAWWLLADRFKATYDAVNGKPYDPEMIICIPNELNHVDKLCAELSQPRREFLNGKFRVEPKEAMAKRNVASPNLADALVMCFMESNLFDIGGLL